MSTKVFTVAGITTHSRAGVTITKARYGNDYVRLIKQLSSNKKIGVKEHLGGRADGYLDAVRVDMVELPSPMSKEDALKFLSTHDSFQSPSDQATIKDEIDSRQPKAPRATKPKAVKVKVAKTKAAPTLDSIKSRAKKSVTPEQVLAAATSAVTE